MRPREVVSRDLCRLTLGAGPVDYVLVRRRGRRGVALKVDATGLTGQYDATVRWMPEDIKPEQLAGVPQGDRPPDVSLFEAFEQQAGLKLEVRRRPTQVLIVDDVQVPDPN